MIFCDLSHFQGVFPRKAESLFSANHFGFDGDLETKDNERKGDRIRAIPFKEMVDMSPANFMSKQKRWKMVLDSKENPNDLVKKDITFWNPAIVSAIEQQIGF